MKTTRGIRAITGAAIVMMVSGAALANDRFTATVATAPGARVRIYTVRDDTGVVGTRVEGDATEVKIWQHNYRDSDDLVVDGIRGLTSMPVLTTCNTGTQNMNVATCNASCESCKASSSVPPGSCVQCNPPCCHAIS